MRGNRSNPEGPLGMVKVVQGEVQTGRRMRMAAQHRLAEGLDDRALRNLILFVDIDDGTDGVVVITRHRPKEHPGTPLGRGRMAGVFIDPQTGKTALLDVKETQGVGSEGPQSRPDFKNTPLNLTLTFPDGLRSSPGETVLPFPAPREPVLKRVGRCGRSTPRDDEAGRGGMADSIAAETLFCGDLFIDFDAYEVMVRGKKVDLPHMTMKLLFFLTRHPGRVYTREKLLDHVWGYDVHVSPRNVDFHVCRIRRAIERDPSKPAHITSVLGVGYKFVDPGLWHA